ncbi:MAG: hypothetical protein IT249_12440 [Chitinophagaceae bacterium]|nr:hypothetical protein [Chitinophagaceae bacterium]
MDLINDNTPSTAKPIIRNGINNSQTMGYNTNATIANGAHITSSISQSKKVIMEVRSL